MKVVVPVTDMARETYLELREVSSGRVVTIIEVLSRVNKLSRKGRAKYEEKRGRIFDSRTNLVEIDLLRAGLPMPMGRDRSRSDYRVVVSRGADRPEADLYPFNLRQPIPVVPLPLLPGDVEPPMDIGAILHALYDRARFDLMLDYHQPPDPPLDEADDFWSQAFRN